jgi:phospholipid-binding lipoprotein MlaA
LRISIHAIAMVCALSVAPLAARADSGTRFVDLSGRPSAQSSAASADATPHFIDLSGRSATPSAPVAQTSQFVDLTGQQRAASASTHGSSLSLHYFDLTTGKMVEITPPGFAASANIYAADEAADPWEDFNRSHFGGHVFLQTDIIDPIEDVYIGVTPRFLRAAVHNFITNLDDPKIFANDVLQIDLRRASGTAARFVVNSSIGIGGILDVATPIGIPFHDNDFGQTLATYGAGDTPYLLVPIIGPSNPRDLAGKVVDIFLDPLEYITVPGGIFTSIGHAAINQLDARSEHVGRLNGLVETTPDPYAAERHDSRARRQGEVESGGFVDGD